MYTHPMAAAYAAEDLIRTRIAQAEQEHLARSARRDSGPRRRDHTRAGPSRRSLTAVLFAGVALGSTAHLAIATVAALAVTDIAGNPALAGLPGAAGVAGTALASLLLTRGTSGRWRNAGLVTGYAVGSVGALVSLLGVQAGSLALLVLGVGVTGAGNASGFLARYVATDLYPEGRQGAVLGTITWAATIGSVLGPLLVVPGGQVAVAAGGGELTGGFLVATVFMGAAALLQLLGWRREPGRRAQALAGGVAPLPTAPPSSVRLPAAAMAVAQAAMVMVMTATPLHIHHHGGHLGTVGTVMTAHTLGMFALSPLVGRGVDRFGTAPILGTGLALLAAASLAGAVGGTGSTTGLAVALWVLGLGWSMAFVAGSSAVAASGGSPRLGGRIDAITWTSGGLAGIVSGVVFGAAGYPAVSALALALLAVTALASVPLRSHRATERGKVAAAGEGAT